MQGIRYGCSLLDFLSEHRPSTRIEEFEQVTEVICFVSSVPMLKGETEAEACPRTLGELKARSGRIVDAMRRAGLFEGEGQR